MQGKLTILVVDDVEINRSILRAIFENEYCVVEADNGKSAISVLEGTEKVDLILLDIIMPEMDGITFIKEIKKIERFKNIPIVITTQEENTECEYQALELGADDFIRKPYNPKIIKRRVLNIIEKNILERKILERNLRDTELRFNTVVETMPGGVGVFKVEKGQLHLLDYNTTLCRMLGYTQEELAEVLNEDIYSCVFEADRLKLLKSIQILQNKKRVAHVKVRLMRRGGSYQWIRITAKRMETEDGSLSFIAVFTDMTEEKEAEIRLRQSLNELKFRVEKDVLTGVFNDVTFNQKAQEMMHKNIHESYVIGYWSIDRFKVVNELFGKRIGDEILRSLALWFRNLIGHEGVYGRIQADNFATCTTKRFIDKHMKEIEDLLCGYTTWNEIEYPIMLHAGFYEVEDVKMQTESMCDRADMALKSIKGNYIKRVSYYDTTLKDSILMEQELVNDMETALAQKQFYVQFQPIIMAKTGEIVSAEALVRWNHKTKGIISPGIFIPIFEKNGFISKLDFYVAEETCKFLAKNKQEGKENVPVSINLSRISFYNNNICEDILALVHKYDIEPSLLKIEITESAYNDNAQDLFQAMKSFQEKGFKVLMDDFGSGYSSLNMLKDITVDILKIDMKFIRDLEKSERACNILFSIIQMAKSMNMEVIAEGVETANQYELLSSMGCDCIQGYYFYRPLSMEDFRKRLEERRDKKGEYKVDKTKKTLLVVDDQELNRVVLRESLSENYNVLTAVDGEDALNILKLNFANINLILTDIVMPKMDGFQLLKEIKENTLFNKIPVLVVTAQGEIENEIKALECGAVDTIVKPFDPELLNKRIQNLLIISEKESMQIEVYTLRESAMFKNQIQEMMGSNVASICRMRLEWLEEEKNVIVRDVVFQNDNFKMLHQLNRKTDLYVLNRIEYYDDMDGNKAEFMRTLTDAVEKRKSFFQKIYRVAMKDGTIKRMIANCNLTYSEEDNSVLLDVVELEVVESAASTIQKSLQVFLDEVLVNTDLSVWRYDVKQDAIEIMEKDNYGRRRQIRDENVSKRCAERVLYREKDRERLKSMYDRILQGEKRITETFLVKPGMIYGKEKKNYWWNRITYTTIFDENGQPSMAIGYSEDVTKEKKSEKIRWRERQYKEMFRKDAVLFFEVDLTENRFLTRIRIKGNRYEIKSSYDQFLAKNIDVIPGEKGEEYMAQLQHDYLCGLYEKGTHEVKMEIECAPFGDRKYEFYTIHIFMSTDESNGHVCASFKLINIQEEQIRINRIARLAEQDSLTALLNRNAFETKVKEVLEQQNTPGKLSAFIIVDIDNFKNINDSFGHIFGDNVLKAMANTLKQTFRRDDLICRLGGDEFTVFISNIASRDALLMRTQELCRSFRMSFDNAGSKVSISCSVGIYFSPNEADEFEDLYSKADEALYLSKQNGKGKITVYDK